MTNFVLEIGLICDRPTHINWLKFTTKTDISQFSRGEFRVKPDPEIFGENIKLGVLFEARSKEELEIFLIDNGWENPFIESDDEWKQPGSIFLPIPNWGKLETLLRKIFDKREYKFSSNPLISTFIPYLWEAFNKQSLADLYEAMHAILEQVELSDEVLQELKENTLKYNFYYFA